MESQETSTTTTGNKDNSGVMTEENESHLKENENELRQRQVNQVELEKIKGTGISNSELLYSIEDVPPWYICIFLGFQNYIDMIGATVACPFFLAPALCMQDDDPDKANVASTLVFMSGIITLLQTTFGTRLPIVQGGSFSYLIPALTIMKLPRWQCPSSEILAGMSDEEKTELWQIRMREIQGAIIFASIFQVLFAITGVIGFIFKFLTPMAVAPVLCLIGISLFNQAAEEASKNYAVSISTLLLLLIFSQHLRNIKIKALRNFPIFQVFPVLLSVLVMWSICGILTATNAISSTNPARTDFKLKILTGSPWFRVPYPFQWGWPTVSIGAVLGMACGVMTSALESLGDYCACATIIKKPTPPMHAHNRGILMEGIGCVVGGLFGSGNGSTSYSNNIGTISVTRVASRRVIQVAAVIMICLSLCGKAGAVFISLPDPILAGMFLFVLPLVISIGLGTLSEVSVDSSRNIFIVSFAISTGLTISSWVGSHPNLIQTGNETLDNLIQILLSTGMFLAGFIGFVLDNTIAGTDEERGLLKRREAEKAAAIAGDTTYDLPIGMNWIRKTKWLQKIPISPTYDPSSISLLPFRKKKSEDPPDTQFNGTVTNF